MTRTPSKMRIVGPFLICFVHFFALRADAFVQPSCFALGGRFAGRLCTPRPPGPVRCAWRPVHCAPLCMKAGASELAFLKSVDVFLRARGTPISVQQLAQVVPRPADLTGKFVKILASDERFQIQDLGTLLPMVQMRKDAPPKPKTEAVPSSIVTNREKFLSSVDTFLRARGTPISVQQLAQAVPRPDLTGKLITILASDARFQIQDLGSSVPMVQMRQPAPSIAKVRARWLSSVDAFLRARGTPISVGLLGKECPRPAELTGKFITILASDARFRLEGLESSVPMVGMRTTPPKSKAWQGSRSRRPSPSRPNSACLDHARRATPPPRSAPNRPRRSDGPNARQTRRSPPWWAKGSGCPPPRSRSASRLASSAVSPAGRHGHPRTRTVPRTTSSVRRAS
ncbi:hypothetical protein T484DRAFT_1879183 [Baffinella frigidus]|nr:hypothetical protein T484DRAFT_1879183 [Cryptophyta sp. CCMP2293]